MKTNLLISLIVVLVVLFLSGCATPYKPPQTYKFEKERVVNKSYDKVWEMLITFFVEADIPIEQMDKTSNVIRSKTMKYGSSGQLCDCGVPGSGFGWQGKIEEVSCNWNILLTKINENQTKVRVVANYNALHNLLKMDFNTKLWYITKATTINCNSTGYFESAILEFLSK